MEIVAQFSDRLVSSLQCLCNSVCLLGILPGEVKNICVCLRLLCFIPGEVKNLCVCLCLLCFIPGEFKNICVCLHQVYEKVGSGKITAEAVIGEFSAQYPGEDSEILFGSDSDYDDTRRVSKHIANL